MLTGESPFGRGVSDEMILQMLARGGEFKYPVYLSSNAVDLISRLCDRDPDSRLGGGGVNVSLRRWLRHPEAHASLPTPHNNTRFLPPSPKPPFLF